MHVGVLVKQVPDSWAEKSLDATSLRLPRGDYESVLNDLDEYAVELAVNWNENLGDSTVAICLGPESAADAVRRALQIGIDEALIVSDPTFAGVDALGTATILAAAVQRARCDVVLAGAESTDAKTAVVPVILAELLGWAVFTNVVAVERDGSNLHITCSYSGERITYSHAGPAVISVVEKFNEPRYPNFKGIMAAKKKTVTVLGAADLEISDVVPVAKVTSSVLAPARSAGIVVDASAPDFAQVVVETLKEKQVL